MMESDSVIKAGAIRFCKVSELSPKVDNLLCYLRPPLGDRNANFHTLLYDVTPIGDLNHSCWNLMVF